MFTRFDKKPASDGQTDDGRTERNAVGKTALSIAARCKNDERMAKTHSEQN